MTSTDYTYDTQGTQRWSSTTFLFVAYDGNGSVVALIDAATGSVAALYEYDPFGNTMVATGAAATDALHRFSTKYRDTEAAYYYYGRRFYSPGLPPTPSGSWEACEQPRTAPGRV